ncbi:unnamed protein product [Ostreobium quekettii]|uniref:Uncharacterized protein n=1 Tax=Ostreobium quekettii TaxID=121088 RepID=A0A8S1J7G3_9CHLO|nr:unnamed protein product [Ostreobium quekettii]
MAESEVPGPPAADAPSTSGVREVVAGAGGDEALSSTVPAGRREASGELFLDQAGRGRADGIEGGGAGGPLSGGADALAGSPDGCGAVGAEEGVIVAGRSNGDKGGAEDENVVSAPAHSERKSGDSKEPILFEGHSKETESGGVGESGLGASVDNVPGATDAPGNRMAPKGDGGLDEQAAGCSEVEGGAADGRTGWGVNGFGRPAVAQGGSGDSPLKGLQSDGPACPEGKQRTGSGQKEGWQESSCAAEEGADALASAARGSVDSTVAVVQWASPEEHSDVDEIRESDRAEEGLKENGFHGGDLGTDPCAKTAATAGPAAQQDGDLASAASKSRGGAVCKDDLSLSEGQACKNEEIGGQVPEPDGHQGEEESSSGAAVDGCLKDLGGQKKSTGVGKTKESIQSIEDNHPMHVGTRGKATASVPEGTGFGAFVEGGQGDFDDFNGVQCDADETGGSTPVQGENEVDDKDRHVPQHIEGSSDTQTRPVPFSSADQASVASIHPDDQATVDVGCGDGDRQSRDCAEPATAVAVPSDTRVPLADDSMAGHVEDSKFNVLEGNVDEFGDFSAGKDNAGKAINSQASHAERKGSIGEDGVKKAASGIDGLGINQGNAVPDSDARAPSEPTKGDVRKPAEPADSNVGDCSTSEIVDAVTPADTPSERPIVLQGEDSGGANESSSKFREFDDEEFGEFSGTLDGTGDAVDSWAGPAGWTGSTAKGGKEGPGTDTDSSQKGAESTSVGQAPVGPTTDSVEQPVYALDSGGGNCSVSGNARAETNAAASAKKPKALQGEASGADNDTGSDFGEFVEGSEDEFGEFGGFQDGTEDAADFGNSQEPNSAQEVQGEQGDDEFGDFEDSTELPTSAREKCAGDVQGSSSDAARDLTALHGEEFLSEVSKLFLCLKRDGSEESSVHGEMDKGTALLDALRFRHVGPPVGVVGSFGLLSLAQPPLGALRNAGPPVLLTAKVSRAEGRLFTHMGLPEPVIETNKGQVQMDVGELAAFTQNENKVVSTPGGGMDAILDFDFLVQASGGSNISKSNLSIADSTHSVEPSSSSFTHETSSGTATANADCGRNPSGDSQAGLSPANAISGVSAISDGSSTAGTTARVDDPFANIPALALPTPAKAGLGEMTDPFCQVPALELPNSGRQEPPAVTPSTGVGTGLDLWYSETPEVANPACKAHAGGDLLSFEDGGFESAMFSDGSKGPPEVGFGETVKTDLDEQPSEASHRGLISRPSPNAEPGDKGSSDEVSGSIFWQGAAASAVQGKDSVPDGLEKASLSADPWSPQREQDSAVETTRGEFESEARCPAVGLHPGDSSSELPSTRGGDHLDDFSSGPPSKGIDVAGSARTPWRREPALVGHRVVSSDTDLVWQEAQLDEGNGQQPPDSDFYQSAEPMGQSRFANAQAGVSGLGAMDVWGTGANEGSTVSAGQGPVVETLQQPVAKEPVQASAFTSTDDWGDFKGNDDHAGETPFVLDVAAVGGPNPFQAESVSAPVSLPGSGLNAAQLVLPERPPQSALVQLGLPKAPRHGHGGSSEPAAGQGGGLDFDWGSFQLPAAEPTAAVQPHLQFPELMAGGHGNASMRPPALATGSVLDLSLSPQASELARLTGVVSATTGPEVQAAVQGGVDATKVAQPVPVEDDDWGEFQSEPTADPFGFLNPIK